MDNANIRERCVCGRPDCGKDAFAQMVTDTLKNTPPDLRQAAYMQLLYDLAVASRLVQNI